MDTSTNEGEHVNMPFGVFSYLLQLCLGHNMWFFLVFSLFQLLSLFHMVGEERY
jgi:hypothetical protein